MDSAPFLTRMDAAASNAERRIVEAMPEILDAVIAKAKDGDTRAAFYLLDRMLGRPAASRRSPADYPRDATFSDDQVSELLNSLSGSFADPK